MKPLPQLNQNQLTEWREEILGERSNKFPDSFLFEQLFFERSPLSKAPKLSERLEILLSKYPQHNISSAITAMLPDILIYLRDNDYIDEAAYEEENNKCLKLVSG